MAILDWEWGRNSAPREGQKSPVVFLFFPLLKLKTKKLLRKISSKNLAAGVKLLRYTMKAIIMSLSLPPPPAEITINECS